jgi:hypothetical protein
LAGVDLEGAWKGLGKQLFPVRDIASWKIMVHREL